MQTETVHTTIETTLGELTLARRGPALTGLYFPHHWHRPDPAALGERSDDGFAAITAQLHEYLSGERRTFDVPTEATGNPAELRVWALIARIPYGETATYGDLAAALDDGTHARDVGGMVGRNPLSIVVPCHRVVGANGKLTGYAGGLRRKRALLDLEAAQFTLAVG
jgi:methylated-DNA-[protein]-cysteine S-methyltransferase